MFNVFGKRQDPDGAYAAVIPKWIAAMLNQEEVFINGDGETSRDFCFIDNVVQINILAALKPEKLPQSEVFNVAVGGRTSLNELFVLLKEKLRVCGCNYSMEPVFREFRKGDVKHSQADISKTEEFLGFSSSHLIESGMDEAIGWYVNFL